MKHKLLLAIFILLILLPPVKGSSSSTHVNVDTKPAPTIEYAPEKSVDTFYVQKKQVVRYVSSTHNKYEWLEASSIPRSDWRYADYIIQKESGWRYNVWNQGGSSAYGLCQTMTSIHKPPQSFYNDPVEQLQWCDNYAKSRYGTWAKAYQFWLKNSWW